MRMVRWVDLFRAVRADDGVILAGQSGRVREWQSAAAAVRALESAGEDLANWCIYWQPAGALGWRRACLASDAGDVFAGR